MQKIIRLIAGIMVVCTIMTLLSSYPIAAEPEEDSGDEVQFLIDLGIYRPDDDMEIGNETLNRETFASLLSVFYGLNDVAYPTTTTLEDVSEYWASGHIMTMINHNLMDVYDDGLFRPKANVTVGEAVKTLIHMIGYDTMAEIKGGYPKGYIQEATRAGILDGIEYGDGTQELTKNIFTKLLINVIKVPVTVQTVYGTNNTMSIIEGKTLLTENLKIYKVSDVLESIPFGTVTYDEPASHGEVIIGGETYICDFDAYKYLGLNIDAYYRKINEDDIGEVLHIDERKVNDCIIVEAEDISSVTGTKFNYYEKNRERSITIPRDMVVVFNGKRLADYTPEHLKPKQGRVKFIDNGTKDGYDYAIVEYEIDYLVEDVSEANNIFYFTDKNDKGNLFINVGNEECICTVIDSTGEIIKLNKIAKYDVITVMANSVDLESNTIKSDSTWYRIIRSKEITAGKLLRKSNETAAVNEVEYGFADNSIASSLNIGTVYTFYINYKGQIVGFDEVVSKDKMYGILLKSALDGVFTQKIKFVVLTQEGKMVVYEAADTVSVDGIPYKNHTALNNRLVETSRSFANQINTVAIGTMLIQDGEVWQLVKFSVNNDGKINKIDTAVENTNEAEDDLKLSGATPKTTDLKNNAGSGNIGGLYGVDNSTVFFEFMSDAEGKLDFEKNTSFKLNNFDGRFTGSSVIAYNMDDLGVCDVIMAGAAAQFSNTIPLYESTNVMIFEGTELVKNADGEYVPHVYGYSAITGNKLLIEIERTELLDNPVISLSDMSLTGSPVHTGDIIRYALNAKGQISLVQRHVAYDGSEGAAIPATQGYGKRGGYYVTTRGSYGRVVNYNKSRMLIRYEEDDGSIWIEPRALRSDMHVFLYNDIRGVNSLTKVTLDELYSDNLHGRGDMISSFSYGATMNTIVIYRH